MNRLITFGCSLAYGHGLSDCFKWQNNEPGDVASELAFPALIAKRLKLDNFNLSRPGASNKEIWNKAINFAYETTDTVIVHWSYPDRTIIYNDNGTETHIAPWQDNIESSLFYKHFHSDIEAYNDFYLRLDQLNHFYKMFKINARFFVPKRSYYRPGPKWCLGHIMHYSIDEMAHSANDFALDGIHPGRKTHYDYANQLLTILK